MKNPIDNKSFPALLRELADNCERGLALCLQLTYEPVPVSDDDAWGAGFMFNNLNYTIKLQTWEQGFKREKDEPKAAATGPVQRFPLGSKMVVDATHYDAAVNLLRRIREQGDLSPDLQNEVDDLIGTRS